MLAPMPGYSFILFISLIHTMVHYTMLINFFWISHHPLSFFPTWGLLWLTGFSILPLRAGQSCFSVRWAILYFFLLGNLVLIPRLRHHPSDCARVLSRVHPSEKNSPSQDSNHWPPELGAEIIPRDHRAPPRSFIVHNLFILNFWTWHSMYSMYCKIFTPIGCVSVIVVNFLHCSHIVNNRYSTCGCYFCFCLVTPLTFIHKSYVKPVKKTPPSLIPGHTQVILRVDPLCSKL